MMCCEDVQCLCMDVYVHVHVHVLAWCLVLGAPSVVVMAGCVLVCSTSGRGRKHCKQEMAAKGLIGHSRTVPQHRCRSIVAHKCCCLAAWCSSCKDDCWLCACVQHLLRTIRQVYSGHSRTEHMRGRDGRKLTIVGVGVSSVGMTPFELMPSRAYAGRSPRGEVCLASNARALPP